MLKLIKELLPSPVRKVLIALKSRTIDVYRKKKLVKNMLSQHQKLLSEIQSKDKVRVVFLVIHENTWKADEVYKEMLQDDFFEPIILVVPYVTYNGSTNISLNRTLETQNKTYQYFLDKNYEVYKACNELGQIVNSVSDLSPDLVYFSCPYPETKDEFYTDIFKNYLSFYIPYFYMIYSWGEDDHFYNLNFHTCMWRIYMPHRISYNRALAVSHSTGQWCLTGYPSCERLYRQQSNKNAWRSVSDNKVKLIWAPHHSIYEDVKPNLGSFLFVAECLKKIAIKYKDKLYIAFKPHPLLKAKLDDHPDWGVDKTNDYYGFWDSSGFSQLDEGEYIDLFIQSDAMLHDSSSFLVEYLFVKKPVMYIDFKNNFMEQFNEFGMKAYNSCEIAKNINDIELFVSKLLAGDLRIKKEHGEFLEREINPFYKDKLPSERIVDDLKHSLGILSDE